jgi:hypothetical protein
MQRLTAPTLDLNDFGDAEGRTPTTLPRARVSLALYARVVGGFRASCGTRYGGRLDFGPAYRMG